MFRFKFRNTLFTRLLALFVVTLLGIQAFAILIFSSMRESMKDEIVRHSESVTSYLVTQIDNVLDMALSKCLTLSTKSDETSVLHFLNYNKDLDEIEYWMNVRAIINDINDSIASSNEIEEIIVHLPTMDLSISNIYGLKPLDEEGFSKLMDSYMSQNRSATWLDNQLNVCYIHANYYSRINDLPKIMLQAKLSSAELQRICNTYAVSGNSNVLLVREATGEIITSGMPVNDALFDDMLHRRAISLDQRYTISYQTSPNSDLMIVQFFPMEQFFDSTNRFSRMFFIFMFLSIPLVLIIIYATYRLIKRPVDDLLYATEQIQKGEINVAVSMPASHEFSKLVISFNNMSNKLRDTIDQLYEQKMHTRESEFRQLQSQINPHFLYNGFFILRHQIQERDWESAENLTNHLSEYFRYITRTGKQEITLAEEWGHCRNYLAIQEMRFGYWLNIEQSPLPDAVSEVTVPRLILQPLLENTLNHGIKDQRNDARIVLRCEICNDKIMIFVEDNGTTLSDERLVQLQKMLHSPSEETTALINIHRRLLLKYGPDYGITLARSQLGGLSVSVVIPIKYGGLP